MVLDSIDGNFSSTIDARLLYVFLWVFMIFILELPNVFGRMWVCTVISKHVNWLLWSFISSKKLAARVIDWKDFRFFIFNLIYNLCCVSRFSDNRTIGFGRDCDWCWKSWFVTKQAFLLQGANDAVSSICKQGVRAEHFVLFTVIGHCLLTILILSL